MEQEHISGSHDTAEINQGKSHQGVPNWLMTSVLAAIAHLVIMEPVGTTPLVLPLEMDQEPRRSQQVLTYAGAHDRSAHESFKASNPGGFSPAYQLDTQVPYAHQANPPHEQPPSGDQQTDPPPGTDWSAVVGLPILATVAGTVSSQLREGHPPSLPDRQNTNQRPDRSRDVLPSRGARMRIAAYVRYSSENQREESIDDQLKAIYEWAEKEGHVVVAVYKDAALSGKFMKTRPGLLQMLADAEEKPRPFDEVVVFHLSRLSRKVRQTLHIHDLLKASGIELTSISDHLTSRDPNAWMNFVIHAMTNEKANQDMNIHMQKGVRRSFEAGLAVGKTPFGYEAAPVYKQTTTNGARTIVGMKLQIVPFEANIVAKAFKMYANGDALNDIIRMINRACAPDRTWSKSGVEAMLQNPIYVGHRVRNRTKKVSHPGTEVVTTERIDDPTQWLSYDDETLRIVDQETWDRAERRRASRSGGIRIEAPKVKLLTGFLVCGGKRPQGEPCEKTITTSARNYYVCNGHYTGTCTSQVSFRREAIEALVLPALGQYLLPWVNRLAGAAMERHRTGQSDVRPLRQEHNKVRDEANRLLAAIQLGVLQGTALESMAKQYQALHNEAEKLDAKIKSILVEENMHEVRYDRAVAEQFLLNLPEALRTNIAEGRRFLGSVIDRIIVTDNGEPRTCPYCNAGLAKVTPRHLKKHGLTIGTYLKDCPSLGFTRSATLTVHLKEDGILREGKMFGLYTSMKQSGLGEHLKPLVIQLDGSTNSDTQPEIGAIDAAEHHSQEAA